jgi:hypothetical protein
LKKVEKQKRVEWSAVDRTEEEGKRRQGKPRRNESGNY